MEDGEFKKLLSKYAAGDCDDEEKALVESWYLKFKPKDAVVLSEEKTGSDVMEIWNVLEKNANGNSGSALLWSKLSVAVLVVFTLSAFLYFQFSGRKKGKQEYSIEYAKEMQPGTDKAVLTLADGRKVNLDSIENGDILSQAGIKVVKSADGHLHYIADQNTTTAPTYNTIQTPNGGKYQITLPDGTEVWLDAASSLKYPTRFASGERKVELSGQAYFEVAKDKSKPFRVITAQQRIDVYGTHFNVCAYPEDDEVQTTLVEGSVKVGLLDNSLSSFIVPGQQSILKSNSFKFKQVDLEEALAWKEGFFAFTDEDVVASLNKLSRWYDVEIVCDEKLHAITLGGNISRSKNLYDVLRILQLTGKIKFNVEGRRIIAMP